MKTCRLYILGEINLWKFCDVIIQICCEENINQKWIEISEDDYSSTNVLFLSKSSANENIIE